MALYFDYFVCTRDQMLEWLHAVAVEDNFYFMQHRMAGHVYFKSLSYEWVQLLSVCGDQPPEVDPLPGVGRIEAFGWVDNAAGPWVMLIGAEVVQTLRRLPLSAETLDRWRFLVADFTDTEPVDWVSVLTYENAVAIQNLCVIAEAWPDLSLFCCHWA